MEQELGDQLPPYNGLDVFQLTDCDQYYKSWKISNESSKICPNVCNTDPSKNYLTIIIYSNNCVLLLEGKNDLFRVKNGITFWPRFEKYRSSLKQFAD